MNNKEFLQWVRNRLVNVHGDPDHVDFINKLDAIIDATPKDDMAFDEIRIAFSEYTRAEGCGCCADDDAQLDARNRLGKLLDFGKYEDGSGYDFYSLTRKSDGKP